VKYLVHAVGDHELPEGVERVIVERDNEPPLLLISGEAARCWRFMRAWEDTQEPCWQPSISLPFKLEAVG
jgi:hypothetical protein